MQTQVCELLFSKVFNISPLLKSAKGWNEKKDYLLVQTEILSCKHSEQVNNLPLL